MRSKEYKDAKCKLYRWRINSVFEAICPLGYSVLPFVGSLKLGIDIFTIISTVGMIVTASIPFSLLTLTLASGAVSFSLFSAVMYQKLTSAPYKRLKERCEALKYCDDVGEEEIDGDSLEPVKTVKTNTTEKKMDSNAIRTTLSWEDICCEHPDKMKQKTFTKNLPYIRKRK